MTDRMGGELGRMIELKGQFDTQRGVVEELVRVLGGAVTNTVGAGKAWFGPAADRFAGAWEGEYQPSLLKLRDSLAEASGEIQRRHDALSAAAG